MYILKHILWQNWSGYGQKWCELASPNVGKGWPISTSIFGKNFLVCGITFERIELQRWDWAHSLGFFFSTFHTFSVQYHTSHGVTRRAHKRYKNDENGNLSNKCMEGVKSADLLTRMIDWYRKDFAKSWCLTLRADRVVKGSHMGRTKWPKMVRFGISLKKHKPSANAITPLKCTAWSHYYAIWTQVLF